VPHGRKSIAFRLKFRAPDRTLRHEEVDEAQAHILKALEQKAGASLRR